MKTSVYSNLCCLQTNQFLILFRSPQDVTARLDRLIEEIKNVIGTNSTGKNVCGSFTKSDIVCVAHGHILSALALRWAEQPLQHGMRLLIETAGVGVLW